MSHTPVPWHCQPEEGNSATWEILTRGGEPVADTWPGSLGPDAAEANAHFIVRAVNNHEELLEAAKSVLAAFDDSHYGGITDPHRSSALNALVRAVQKASG